MKYSIAQLAFATLLAAAAASAQAQQQPHGRDSVYANAAQASSTSATIADSSIPTRFGRDSVYAPSTPASSQAVAVDATGLQRHGRGSVFALQVDQPAGDTGATRIGRAASDRRAN